MTRIVLCFSSDVTADFLVAGVPCAARALREVALATGDGTGLGAGAVARSEKGRPDCVIAVAGGWQPGPWSLLELARLAPLLPFEVVDLAAVQPGIDTLYIQGEALVPAGAIAAALHGDQAQAPGIARHPFDPGDIADELAILRRKGDAIVAATGKPGDGIVSRNINRPISQAISRQLLRIRGVTPLHATFGAAALGIAMACCLFLGGEPGLFAGALLFQAASIVDGVDGEIARATYRTSASGAMLDSLSDAGTNVAFITGLTANLWWQGHSHAAAAGTAGVTLLAVGLLLIGLRARAMGGSFTFDVIKVHLNAKRSRLAQVLTWIAMRDFFAAAFLALILIGLAPHALIAFALATAGWFVVTLTVLLRTRARGPAARQA